MIYRFMRRGDEEADYDDDDIERRDNDERDEDTPTICSFKFNVILHQGLVTANNRPATR